MLIAPIIFCTVVLGIAHVGDMKAVGRIGVKALIYFEVVTTFALIFGLVIGNIVKPGAGFNVNPETLATGAEAVAKKTSNGELPHTVEFLMNIIPTSAISAFAENELLQVLFFAVLFGLALAKIGDRAPIVLGFVDQSSHIFFTMIGWIMKLAPLGAFGAMAYIIGQYGISSLGSYGKLIGCCYLAAVLFILVLAAIVRIFAGVNLWKFFLYIKDEFFVALGSGSVSLLADSVDFLEDTSINLLIFVALGWALAKRAVMGKVMAVVILAPAAFAAWEAAQRFAEPVAPDVLPVVLASLGAIAVNGTSGWLLAGVRHAGGSLSRAAFLSARNDVLVNIAVIAMAGITLWTASGWPDLVLGCLIIFIALHAAAAKVSGRLMFIAAPRAITCAPSSCTSPACARSRQSRRRC